MPDQLDYVAVRPCGCVRACCSAASPPKELAKCLAGWVNGGLSVERMESDQIREKFGVECEVCKPKGPTP